MTNQEWKKANTYTFTMRFTMNSGVPEALRKIQEEHGIQPTAYIRNAVIDRLKADGYMSENSMPEK